MEVKAILASVGLLLVASNALAATAGESLLETAKRELAAGRPQEASLLLERSLGLEPGNPAAWHYLGLAHLQQGHYAQAEAMAAKSHSLAAADRALRARNVELMAEAQQASGKPISVPSNEPPPSVWRRLLKEPIELANGLIDPPSADAAAETLRARPAPRWRRSERRRR
jgi:tetratricopeptide (TPR) repeat protein